MDVRSRCLIVGVLMLVAGPAFAYLDPSTGSMIITAVVGILASIALAVKTYWYKIKSWFRKDDDNADSAPDDPAA